MSASNTFGTATSKGESDTKSPGGQALYNLAAQFAGETSGIRNSLIQQFQEILNTGGSQALLPIISKSVESSKQATSATLKQVDEQLAKQGLAGTPFGEMIRAQTLQQGNQATSQIGPEIAQKIFAMIPGFVQGQSGQAAQAFAGSIPGQQSTSTKGNSIGQSTTGGFSYGGK